MNRMKDFLSPEGIKRTLAQFDEQEKKMREQLASLKEHGPQAHYRVALRAYTRSSRQVEVRRKWLKSLLPETEETE